MNKQEVDARVQSAVENLQAGRGVEDDAGIEFKGDWPEPAKKARQLAGAANALRGGVMLLVIGVEDKTGAITTPNRQEPHEWYAQLRKRFDQIAPELLRVQTVFVGDGDQSVQVLVVDTSEFPYVINDENRREVPIRVGSGTESAHRNQLVRMLEPRLRVPAMSITEVAVRIRWEDQPTPVKDSDPPKVARVLSLDVDLFAKVFVEHSGTEPTTLPVRDMRARLVCGGVEFRPDVRVKHLGRDSFIPTIIRPGDPFPPEPVPPQFGVYALDNHVTATAPGEFTINTGFDYSRRPAPDPEVSKLHDLFVAEETMRLDLAVRVVGIDTAVRLSSELVRTEPFERNARVSKSSFGESLTASLGVWELKRIDRDPWA